MKKIVLLCRIKMSFLSVSFPSPFRPPLYDLNIAETAKDHFQLINPLISLSLQICPVVLKKKIASSIYFWYFLTILPWKTAWPFRSSNWNSLYLRMLCAKFAWNWPNGSGEEYFSITSMYCRYFIIICLWKKGVHLFELGFLWPKYAFC